MLCIELVLLLFYVPSFSSLYEYYHGSTRYYFSALGWLGGWDWFEALGYLEFSL